MNLNNYLKYNLSFLAEVN